MRGARVPHFSRLWREVGPFKPTPEIPLPSTQSYTIPSIGENRYVWHPTEWRMSSEEYIKDLCARVITAEGAEFVAITNELHAALKSHIDSLRSLVLASLLPPPTPPDIPPKA